MNDREFVDSIGNSLHVGNFVIYEPTGTKGKITELISNEDGAWALVDKTDLLYRTEVLTNIKEFGEEEIGEKEFSREEVSEVLEKEKEFAPTEMDDVSLESGG